MGQSSPTPSTPAATDVAHVTVRPFASDDADEEEEAPAVSVRFLWIALDFLARAHAQQQRGGGGGGEAVRFNVWPLPSPHDAVGLDAMQDFWFCGTVQRSLLVLEGAPWAAQIALMPPFVQCDMEVAVEEEGAQAQRRAPRPKRTRRAHELEASQLPNAERMCLDPLWVAVVRHYQQVGTPLSQEEMGRLVQQCHPAEGQAAAVEARIFSHRGPLPYFEKGVMVHHALDALRQKYALPWPGLLPSVAHSARLLVVPRGVALRVVTRRLEDLPPRIVNVSKRQWQVGHRHAVQLRRALSPATVADLASLAVGEEPWEEEEEGGERPKKRCRQGPTPPPEAAAEWFVL